MAGILRQTSQYRMTERGKQQYKHNAQILKEQPHRVHDTGQKQGAACLQNQPRGKAEGGVCEEDRADCSDRRL